MTSTKATTSRESAAILITSTANGATSKPYFCRERRLRSVLQTIRPMANTPRVMPKPWAKYAFPSSASTLSETGIVIDSVTPMSVPRNTSMPPSVTIKAGIIL
ncbi:hypothetical protein D3C81_1272980 [compost metagenome]